MIIFLNLKDQILKGESSFAFYDTISNTILEFDGQQVFDSKEEFEHAYLMSPLLNRSTRPLSRFISLIPQES